MHKGIALSASVLFLAGTLFLLVSPIGAQSLPAWRYTTSMSVPHFGQAVVQWHNYVYAIGGATAVNHRTNIVERAQFNADGSLGPWQTMTPLTQTLAFMGAAVWGDYIYLLGGESDSCLNPDWTPFATL